MVSTCLSSLPNERWDITWWGMLKWWSIHKMGLTTWDGPTVQPQPVPRREKYSFYVARQPTGSGKEIGRGILQDLLTTSKVMIFRRYQSDLHAAFHHLFFTSKHIVDLLQPKGPLCITSHRIRPVLFASCGCLRWEATSANTCSSVTTQRRGGWHLGPRNGWAHVFRSIALKGWEVPKITTTEGKWCNAECHAQSGRYAKCKEM